MIMAFLPDAADSGFFFKAFDRRCYRFCRWTLYNKFPTGFIISSKKSIKDSGRFFRTEHAYNSKQHWWINQ